MLCNYSYRCECFIIIAIGVSAGIIIAIGVSAL